MAAEVAVELAQTHVEALKAKLGREWISAWHTELLAAEAALEEARRMLQP